MSLSQILARNRHKDESRNAQAHRMGFSEGALRFYERGGLPNGNTIPALARALGIGEAKLRQVVEREKERMHAADGESATGDATATIPTGLRS